MVLAELHLDAFRAFAGARLESLGRINLVVGANNTGKSSILEAAGIVLRPFDPGQWVQTALHRDTSADLVEGMWSMFPRADALRLQDGPQQSRPLHIDATLSSGSRSLRGTALASESWDIQKMKAGADLRLELHVEDEGHLPAKHVMEFAPYIPAEFGREVRSLRVFTVTPATHRSTKALVEHLSRVVNEGKKELALSLLRLFDPAVEDLAISNAFGRDAIRLTHETRGVVDLSSFGDGMRRSAAIALALTRASGGVVLVDELEAGIHPRALGEVAIRLMKAAREADVQILATTHSLEAIDAVLGAVSEDSPEDVVGYHLRREGDQHHVRRYDGPRLARLREAGLDLR